MKKIFVFILDWLFIIIQFTIRALKGILILSLFFYPIYLLLNYFGWISGISLSLFTVLVSALIMIRRNNSWRDIGLALLFIGQMIFMDSSVYEDKEPA
ncbi:MAG: hypothetical protein KBD26_00160 [Candidatus Pacebacteria bacterium]|nr:hypothetical protein [Candidatus Paceibacterota bacterium]QQR76924.1 MAG: hypothetical protein IPJ63_01520 [Candidatus Nomurabacteria bacterium]